MALTQELIVTIFFWTLSRKIVYRLYSCFLLFLVTPYLISVVESYMEWNSVKIGSSSSAEKCQKHKETSVHHTYFMLNLLWLLTQRLLTPFGWQGCLYTFSLYPACNHSECIQRTNNIYTSCCCIISSHQNYLWLTKDICIHPKSST